MKFKIGDQVMHCRDGLSTIISSTTISDNEYFLVKSNKINSETTYVPISKADSIIRKIMTAKEADEVLKGIKNVQKEFNTNTKQRRDAFKRRLNSGDVNDIAYLYRLYYIYTIDPEGVRLGPSDVEMLSSATEMLLDELSLSYKIERESTPDFVVSKIEKL